MQNIKALENTKVDPKTEHYADRKIKSEWLPGKGKYDGKNLKILGTIDEVLGKIPAEEGKTFRYWASVGHTGAKVAEAQGYREEDGPFYIADIDGNPTFVSHKDFSRKKEEKEEK